MVFEHIKFKDLYVEKIKLCAKYGILNLSNFILYNYKDSPTDLYRRLKINVLLNKQLGTDAKPGDIAVQKMAKDFLASKPEDQQTFFQQAKDMGNKFIEESHVTINQSF